MSNNIRLSADRKKKEIVDFLKMLKSRLEYAFDKTDVGDFSELDKMYEQDFEISFMGKKCTIAFGAEEYNTITNALEHILEEI